LLCAEAWARPPAAIAAASEPESDLQPELRNLLSKEFRFSSTDLANLVSGKIVAYRLGATAVGEAGAIGAVRISVPKQTLIDLYRDIVRFKRGPDVTAIGRFGEAPSVADLESLPLDRQDVNLRDCRPGDCDIRLPASAILRFQHEIDWTAPDADARAAALFKQILADNVRAYMSGGPGRIIEYDNDKHPIRPVDDFVSLVEGAAYLDRLAPGLSRHFETFPSNPLPGAEDIVYWSKEKFGRLAPFVTVTHVAIVRPASAFYVVASRDVYSSRYLDASLSVTIVSDAVATPEAFYCVYINRSRAEALKGLFAGLRRSIVERRVKSGLEENLRLTKLRLEGAHRP
jgi:hypothetical protein